MTQFADLVTRAWAHAKCPDGPLYLAGRDEDHALLSEEPTAYSESFIARCEEITGCTFDRVPVTEFEGLWLEYDYWLAAYARVENKNYWSDGDRQWWNQLGERVALLRKAIRAYCPSEPHTIIEDEEAREAAHADSQFGVGA
jgi:hypothetical protein